MITQEKADELNKRQYSGKVHPYTCSRIPDECEKKQDHVQPHMYDGILIATTEGWVCPCGKYTQEIKI